jgi:hypothetical protein
LLLPDIETEVADFTVVDNVILTFEAKLALGSDLGQ